MKKHFLAVITAGICVCAVKGQGTRLGVHSGIDAAQITIAGATGEVLRLKPGITAGVHFEAAFSQKIGLQAELNYSQQGTSIVGEQSGFGSFSFDYITIPVLAKFYGTPRFSLLAGPQLGIRAGAQFKTTTDVEADLDNMVKTTDFYLVFGGEYRFASGLFLGARYHFGLLNVAKEGGDLSAGEIKNRYYSFRIGYGFPLSKQK